VNDFYEKNYNELFYSRGIASIATRFIHIALEFKIRKENYPLVLEIGGGEGNHVPFVRHSYKKYTLSDIDRRPLNPVAAQLLTEKKLKFDLQNAHKLSYEANSFDRVVLMCVLHHLENPEKSLAEARRVLKPGGLASIYLPCDPGLVYRMTRSLLVGFRSKKLGLNYRLLNAQEHRNHVQSLELMVAHVFSKDSIRTLRFPFGIKFWNMNYFYVIHIHKGKN
jgi:phosphatidylethanolamine/phosphatidyl-N-methylethanolamine N-methyltransferase